MSLSLADIRARLLASDNKGKGDKPTYQSDNAVYPHWNIEEGTSATVRILVDGDSTNPDFWRERQMIKIPFNGVKGDPSGKRVEVQVPCMEMFGEKCPILTEIRPWYNDPVLKERAGTYWKKRSYLFQGFVRKNPMAEDQTPANPIRRFTFSSQIFPIIKAILVDPELRYLPCDYQHGRDFRINKTTKGQWADYSTSTWAMSESALTDAELEAIETHKLWNLVEHLPKKPTAEDLIAIKEMFEASVDGMPYDPDRWGQFYRPAGLKIEKSTKTQVQGASLAPTVAPSKQETSPSQAPWDGEENFDAESPAPVAPVAPVVKPTESVGKQDVMAIIRARQQKLGAK